MDSFTDTNNCDNKKSKTLEGYKWQQGGNLELEDDTRRQKNGGGKGA